VVSIYAVV